ncbi:MAG: ribosome small subunit-dependent GTPase A [Myxococcota bacterium]
MVEGDRGQVVRAAGGFYDVRLDSGEVRRCTMRGRLKRERRKTDLCVIGDWVRVRDEKAPTLESIEERRNTFSRQHPGRGGKYREDVLVANLDRLYVVFAYGERPPMRPRLLDRFLVVAEQAGIPVTIVANKSDLNDGADPFAPYEALGYAVVRTRATGLDAEVSELRAAFEDGTVTAFVGPSGVGKSSLLNALEPSFTLRTGLVGAHGKGRHTTRVATLHEACGGYVADTPGIRELGAFELDRQRLDRYFVEMRPFLGRCAFGDCVHDQEPNCAVKAAVGDAISPERYESYLRLLHGEDSPVSG